MNQKNNRWQIKDLNGRVLVDHVSHAIALEMLAILQHHVKQITMAHFKGEAS
jgi:hypothetical protein